MSEPMPIKDNTSDIFLVEGILTELHVASGKENLLAQVDRHYRANSVITGMGAVVGDMFGQASAAASVALYDGEETEHFLCLIGDTVVGGTFAGASKLPVGKHVKAAVRQKETLASAEGILSESDGLVWLRHAWGAAAESIANFKIAAWCFGFSMVCVSAYILFIGGNPQESKLESILWIALPTAAICFGIAFWNSVTMNVLADPATGAFRVLGFADPEKVNLNSYQYGIVHGRALLHSDETRANHGNIHCYKKALEDGKVRMAST
ncbi:hypothetical protein HF313_27475 [Massilia atriviolacea]|uniref:Uncharacterized protein n=1 Tax=Massilia atriviolacea TaxID=2495579 RepID=A0A430HJD9_9BURK|nr:hypothetical protein [Massilia atriviolacea]RSZ57644.1 hypothetical protein EJB06_18330 [Massilia atriviolacea]